jgi:RNA polymerase sigma-70 factor, ECF subfamily
LRPLRLTVTAAEVRAYLRATARTVLAAHWRQTLGLEITSIDDLAQAAPNSDQAISTAPHRVQRILKTLPTNTGRFWICASCKGVRSKTSPR